ncbi:hypothetical protein BT63DRAFT_132702 [Microthyrium microscopicum]|uniref:G-protein coupled receptors family 2 profile 2 domain-containing protein n=1 Tax=Microthyrium microscopicum TaxID=703497 RepID=A0A6A6UMG6_9PEZI|nr:hypothetical protein BT63DRAFT_132702 [Microthyrium microscopicum]
MAVNVFLTFNTTRMNVDLQKLEKWYFLFCYGVPAVPALTYLGLDVTRGTDYYGNATLWCWISAKHDKLRLSTFYGPVWIVITLTMILYGVTGRSIQKGQIRNRLMRNQLSHHEPELPDIREEEEEYYNPKLDIVTRTEISQCSDFRDPSCDIQSVTSSTLTETRPSISTIQRPSTARFIPIRVPGFGDGTAVPGAATALTPPSSPPAQDVHTTSSRNNTPSPSNEGRLVPRLVTTSIYTSPSSPVIRITSALSNYSRSTTPTPPKSSASKRMSSQMNRGARTYAKLAFLLYLIMLTMWIPSTMNRVYSIVRDGKISFGLCMAAAVVLPLQGFFNALVYAVISRRELFSRFKKQTPVIEICEVSSSPTSRPSTKNSWHRATSRDEVVLAEEEDDEDFSDQDNLRFPWHDKTRVTTTTKDLPEHDV